MYRDVICSLALVVAVAGIDVQTLRAAETSQIKEVKTSSTLALSEAAPELY